jgi:pimeloyl-ACP methyl ester carboxylesterase
VPNSQARRPAPRPAAPRLHSGRAPALLRSPVARDASGPSRTGLNRRFAFGAGQLLAELLRPPRRGDAGPILGGLVLGIGAGLALERVAMLSETRLRPDPEADEPFGTLTGTPATVRSWDGTAIHVEELGQGPTLIFGHGFSMSGQAWHYQRRDLPEAFRCVFIDQRGHGASGRPSSGDYSLEAIARDIGAVIDWAGGREKVVLVMHSMSGMAALKLAELEPDLIARRVAGLVLVDTSYADNLRGMAAALGSRGASRVQLALYSAAYRMAGQDPPRALQLRRRGSDIGYLTTRLFGFGSNPSPSQVAFTDRLLAGTDVEVWAQVFPGLLDFDLEHVLETLPVPALVVAGDSDRLFPVSAATHMAGTIPDARLLILPDSGHMAFMEEHELLDSELAAFARRVMGLPQGPPHGLAAGAHG